MSNVMPDLIRHPGKLWVPTFAGMTVLIYVIAGVIKQMMGEDMKAAISRKRDGTDFLVCVVCAIC